MAKATGASRARGVAPGGSRGGVRDPRDRDELEGAGAPRRLARARASRERGRARTPSTAAKSTKLAVTRADVIAADSVERREDRVRRSDRRRRGGEAILGQGPGAFETSSPPASPGSRGAITLFESQGIAIEDVAAAKTVYERGRGKGAEENRCLAVRKAAKSSRPRLRAIGSRSSWFRCSEQPPGVSSAGFPYLQQSRLGDVPRSVSPISSGWARGSSMPATSSRLGLRGERRFGGR